MLTPELYANSIVDVLKKVMKFSTKLSQLFETINI